ncbi:Uncharacterised protein [Burkholderia cenocepacia]|nr:Uncharacterised protein [Burkholderia cenocepacia]
MPAGLPPGAMAFAPSVGSIATAPCPGQPTPLRCVTLKKSIVPVDPPDDR